ncbi:MAG: hypothetical protein ACI915_004874, partial [Gammaproteobacteria bacterium]
DARVCSYSLLVPLFVGKPGNLLHHKTTWNNGLD